MRLPTQTPTPNDNNNQYHPSTYPTLEPHITLASLASSTPLPHILSSIPASGSLPPNLTAPFSSLSTGSVYFRSVYLRITPTPALLSLHTTLHKNLAVEPRTPSFPHVSLCYVDDEDASRGERERYARVLRESGRVREEEDGVSLNLGEGEGEGEWSSGFDVKEIWIVNCDGPVEGWKPLEKIALP